MPGELVPGGSFCPGCGEPVSACPGCLPPLDPPRHCPACGAWVAVRVTPAGWSARCREHGDLRPLG